MMKRRYISPQTEVFDTKMTQHLLAGSDINKGGPYDGNRPIESRSNPGCWDDEDWEDEEDEDY